MKTRDAEKKNFYTVIRNVEMNHLKVRSWVSRFAFFP
jgi:hypothetical protein